MTAEQPETPLPPEGYATWLDCLAEGDLDLARYDFARAELAALRKELAQANEHRHFCDAIDLAFTQQIEDLKKKLADTEGWLATARQQALDLDAMRAEAVRERDEARDHLKTSWSDCVATARERDEARAKLAELREAVLALGSLNATWIDDRMRYVEVQVDRGDARAWNALIAKLRAAQGGEGKP